MKKNDVIKVFTDQHLEFRVKFLSQNQNPIFTQNHEALEEIQDSKFQIQAFLCGLRGFV
jgi:hypothetical protein